MKKRLDLNNPLTFNEKIQWLKLYWQRKCVSESADKYKVREFIIKKGLGDILLPIYEVSDNPNNIDWCNLPESYVAKTTNSCGTNIIVRNINDVNINENTKKLEKWIKEDYGREHLEFQYSKIKPKIIVEKFIESDNFLPQDYKFFCFNGIPRFILYIDERNLETGNKRKGFYDLEWNYLDYIDEVKSTIIKDAKSPERLEEMIEIAKILSNDFPFVRVDLYNEQGKIIFGELTFTPMGGMANYFKDGIDLKIGNYLKLPEKIYKGYTD